MMFDQKYNHDAFSAFLRDFLPEDYVEKEKDIADLSRAKIITCARELGHSAALDLYVLEMTHAKETDPRVSIATDAFKILATFGYDKALVIFKNDESNNYRFSYLTISLSLNEKSKVVAKYSNARRYSFYLGEGAKTKTPEQQLVKRGRVKDTEDLLSRFSLEVVNKQFYLEIAKFFDELVDEMDANLALPFQSDATVRKNFAMRLIGRLMFCWFLKQKKSKDGALVPDELLSASAVKDGYYHAVLETLFFEILNTQIDERDIRSDVYDKVPYLNGGLFSPQHDDYYELDRATFTSRHINTLRVADAWFRDFFALLETYNFTIDENTVFDQELSVDPEMLGRIFENLLAEINPDTGSSERKRTGSYYTPRQVVEYMVDQSLIEYLKTATGIEEKRLAALVSYDLGDDEGNQLIAEENKKVVEAIDELKILDPACGSGAFPIGALQKIVWILQRVDPQCDLWLARRVKEVPELYRKKITDYFHNNPPDYIRKLDVIKNSIFGVDIQSIAVEMSRLRCFLTLVVESEIDDAKKNRGIEPLPNLDFKFVCANTLVGLPKKGSNGLFEDHSGIEELQEIMSEYFSTSNQRKMEIRQKFTNAQKEILNRSLSSFGKTTGELTLKLSLWDPFSNMTSPWFDTEWMFGVDEKFDVVIGNPPYGAKIDSVSLEIIKDLYQYSANGKVESYRIFIERSFQLVANNGVVTLIVPNTWLYLEQAKSLRRQLLEHSVLKHLIVFPQSTFSATVDSMMLLAINKISTEDNVVHTLQMPLKDNLDVIKLDLSEGTFTNQQNWLADDKARISIGIEKDLYDFLNRVRGHHKTFENYVDIRQGLIPYLTKEEGRENKFISKEKVDDTWKEYFDGSKCVDRYRTKGVVSYIKYGDWLYAPREQEIFVRPRIIYQLIRNISLPRRIVATYLDKELYSDRNTGLIFAKNPAVDLKYILGLLNSKLLNFLHVKSHNSTYISFPSIFALPLAVADEKLRREVVGLVDEILHAKQQNVDTHASEEKLDELVMDIYQLTDAEKKMIRSSI